MSGDGLATPLAKILRAIIYIRVSTPGQGEDAGAGSPGIQREKCFAKAAELGATVAEVVEDIHTGVEVLERPGMMRVLNELVPSLRPAFLIAYHPFRITRDMDHAGYIKTLLGHHKVQIRTVQLDQSGNSPLDKMMGGLIYGTGEVDWSARRDATMDGIRKRVEAGKPRAGCKPIYGYRWEDDGTGKGQRKVRLVPDDGPDGTAHVVRRIYRELANGATMGGLAAQFNREGIPMPGAGLKRKDPNANLFWKHQNIRQMVVKQEYKGVEYINRFMSVPVDKRRGPGEKKQYRPVERPREEWVKLTDPAKVIPPLVTPDVWQAAQDTIARNRLYSRGRASDTPEKWLLRKGGFVFCGECGKPVGATGQPRANGQSAPVYRTTKGLSDHPHCAYRTVGAAELDGYVKGHIGALLADPTEVLMRYQARVMTTSDEDTAASAELADLDKRAGALQAKLSRTRALLEDEEDPDEIATLRGRRVELAAERKALEAQRGEIVGRRAAWAAARDSFGDMEAWIREMGTALDSLDWEGWRARLRALKVRVLLNPTTVTPRYTVEAELPTYPGFVTRAGDHQPAPGWRARKEQAHAETDAIVRQYDAWERAQGLQAGARGDDSECSATTAWC